MEGLLGDEREFRQDEATAGISAVASDSHDRT
jgi:hypothetical protein